jgi:uncharacterized membrane protein YqiK
MNELPSRTHNAPPDPIQVQQEDLHQRLIDQNQDMDARIQQLEEAAERGEKRTVDSEELAEAFAEQIAQIARAIKELEDRRTKAKAPFLTLAALVDNYFKRKVDRLDAARKKLAPKLTAWQTLKRQRAQEEARKEAERQRQEAERVRKEREAREAEEARKAEEARRAQEEADRKAREAREAELKAKRDADEAAAAEARRKAEEAARAEAEAAKKQAEAEEANRAARLVRRQEVQQQTITQHVVQQAAKAGGKDDTRVRGIYGAKAVLRETYDFEIEDPNKVPRAYCSPDEGKIRAAINGDTPVRRISGVRIFQKITTQVRN